MSRPPINGILNLDKSPDVSSARALDRVKRLLPRGTKVGHAGTLDPFASGVLLVLVGRATKLCEQLMAAPKQYETVVKLGGTTPTDDAEFNETPTPGVLPVDRAAIDAVIPRFVGEIQQVPPAYSAMKVAGRRAYDLARKGQPPTLAARPVRVDAIEVLEYQWPRLTLRIDCGRGTYVRSIARDLGAALGVGGFVADLRRTRVGSFSVADAVATEELMSFEDVERRLAPVPDVVPEDRNGGAGANDASDEGS